MLIFFNILLTLKNFACYILLFLATECLFAQNVLSLMAKVETSLEITVQEDFLKKLEQNLRKLKKRKLKTKEDKVFVQYVFNFLHQKYLKTYSKATSFTQTIVSGKYNCVVGTALIGFFLEELGYRCIYYETKTHVFLLVYLPNDDKLLIESTAFFAGGLIDDEETIIEIMKKYQPITTIKLIHLVGIQLYNEGVLAYDKQDYLKALSLGNQAYYFYPSTRHKLLCSLAKQELESQKSHSKID